MTTVCIDPQKFLHQFKVGGEFEQLFGGFNFVILKLIFRSKISTIYLALSWILILNDDEWSHRRRTISNK